MTNTRTPGPVCSSDFEFGTIEDGTMCCAPSHAPGPELQSRLRYGQVLDELTAQGDPFWVQVRRAWEAIQADCTIDYDAGAELLLTDIYGDVVVHTARQYLQVREQGANRGTQVEEFLTTAGGQAGQSWCAAFVYWCHSRAATQLEGTTTIPRTVRAAGMWFEEPGNQRFSVTQVHGGQFTPEPGDVFVMADQKYHGHFRGSAVARFPGHTGLVVSYDRTTRTLTTLEGNTNLAGDREGDGVFQRTDRMADERLYGFVRGQLVTYW